MVVKFSHRKLSHLSLIDTSTSRYTTDNRCGTCFTLMLTFVQRDV